MVSSADILNAHILIVDDQEANVLLLERMLSSAGYARITSTRDPQAVCALHSDNHYDLILLDLQMPGMDGFQVMEGLKATETGGYLPVLVITAQPAHKLRALEAGAKDFISKPFDLMEVKTRIHNMLEVRLLYKKIENDNKVLEQTVQERTGELLRANVQLSQEIDREFNFGEIIGRSNALEQVFFKVEQAAPQDTTVLLLGETGTGKGVVARSIHSRSARDRKSKRLNSSHGYI